MASSSSSTSTAFGRSLPSELLPAPGTVPRTPQLWKVNDQKAGKSGNCQAVYWVKERPITTELKRHAKPEKQWETGAIYKGEWLANKKHGYGVQLWANGNKYEGEWADGDRSGHGVFWLKEKPLPTPAQLEEAKTNTSPGLLGKSTVPPQAKLRRVYAGNWKNDMKDGVGVYFYRDGSRYEGNWEADQRCGRGTLYLTNQDQYTGEWKNNLQNGFGTLTKANRDVYEGEWLNGLREGSGIFYYKKQEKIYDGEWVNDQPKCGVYLDAKEFFDDTAEDSKYAAALGASRRQDGQPMSIQDAEASLSRAAREGDPSVVSPRVPRNKPGMPIPRLRMADADAVLAEAIENVALDRAAVRALPHTGVRDLFTDGSLDALRRLFAGYDSDAATGDGSGLLAVRHLPAMLGELALPAMSPPTHAKLLTDMRKTAKERMTFQEFVRAVHLCEEARNSAVQAQEMQRQREQEEDY